MLFRMSVWDGAGGREGLRILLPVSFSGMYTEGAVVAALAHQKLMALPKEAAKFASLKASDTVW